MPQLTSLLSMAALVLTACSSIAQDVPFSQLVEADWISQIEPRSPTGPADDALGACDGVKDGKWGFHTGNDPQAWWQVDLGTATALTRVLVYNRCDGGCAARNVGLKLLLSDHGQQWQEVFQHSGEPFLGQPDGKPLSVDLSGRTARFVRLQMPGPGFLHLDEVEVYGAAEPERNIALWAEATQSSVSQWSVKHRRPGEVKLSFPVEETVVRGRALAQDLAGMGVDVRAALAALDAVEAEARPADADRRALFLRARWAIRKLAFSNPLLGFQSLLFVKRAPGTFSHMSDQNYGWWSRPGGGLYILEGLDGGEPGLRSLTPPFPEGSYNSPDLSADGTRILFSYCRYYPDLSGRPDKTAKAQMPADGYYHVFEMNVDGGGVRQLTDGPYDDFDARYLPNGDIVFLSTRRGQAVQCKPATAMATIGADLPDCYVRCGGDAYRPVAVYTLHRMSRDGGDLRPLSPFENFEWTPSVTTDGRILYARWDYVDRDNMPYMSLWSTNPDGTNPRLIYGNFTRSPHCVFEARSIPGSHKLMFTASAHHCITGGSIALLDPAGGTEGLEIITRLTPEVCFPEIEGWPQTYYANPLPLSESYYLTAWSNVALNGQGGSNAPNALGLYLADRFGNLELIYRDPEISSMFPTPLRARAVPTTVADAAGAEADEGRFLLLDVYAGLPAALKGSVKALRIVGVPPKTQPDMNTPMLGVTGDDPGKYVLGTVPVAEDGSAHFRAPAGTAVFFQALDQSGMALQTMRTLTYLQAGETLSCVGCHESRDSTPTNSRPAAAAGEPSPITVGPSGSWPLRFDTLVRPVLDRRCVSCHRPGSGNEKAAKLDLSGDGAYQSLLGYGSPSLRDQVWAAYRAGRSDPGTGGARDSKLLAMLAQSPQHADVKLDGDDRQRLYTWMDTYSQFRGAFSDDQETRLVELRESLAGMLRE